jgi:xanthine dehydrogenase accessory factor
MKELKRIIEVYENIDFSQRKAAMATVVKLYGSSYRRPGARMLITDDGRWEGAISGGCLEGDALRKARQVMSTGEPMLVTYDTMDDENADSLAVGLGCNGIIDVLIEPIIPDHIYNPINLFKTYTTHSVRDIAVLMTVFRTEGKSDLQVGERFLLLNDGTLHPSNTKSLPLFLQQDLTKVAQSGRSQVKLYEQPSGKIEAFLEVLHPGIHLVIFGGGYDAIPVVRLAKEVGWHVTVSDDCVAHLTPIRFPQANAMVNANRKEILQHIPITPFTATVLMSHNYKYDMAVMENLLTTQVPYIGMLGPRKRFQKMLEQFEAQDKTFDTEIINRVHSPIGLDLGAETPDEIALSIISEIQAVFAGRIGGFLNQKPGFIHERSQQQVEISSE